MRLGHRYSAAGLLLTLHESTDISIDLVNVNLKYR
jgi:hypothetical protein